MATTNVSVTSSWSKVCESTDDPILIQTVVEGATFEAAAMASEETPTVTGHLFEGRGQVVTRTNLGNGYVYCRAISSSSVDLVVTK